MYKENYTGKPIRFNRRNNTSNPAEVLSSKKMSQFIESIKDDYDYIFIDTPPVGIVVMHL